MRTRVLMLIIAILVPLPLAAQTACDRNCLRDFMTRYLDALVAQKPATLPVSNDLKFTEDTVAMNLGEGLWKTPLRLSTYRQDILDVKQGVAGTMVILEDAGKPVMLTVRLKVAGGKISEIETQATHNAAEGAIFRPENLKTASPAMNLVPEKSQLNSREDLIRISQKYPEGLKAGSFVTADTPFAPDAYRFEGGQIMAGPACTRGGGCDNIKTQRIPKLSGIRWRVAVVDEELGIAWLRLDFGPGSLFGENADKSLIVWEAFKIYGSQIHAVEAFMKVGPQNAPSGWDN